MEGPEVRCGGTGHHWVKLEWGDPSLQEPSASLEEAGSQDDSAQESSIGPTSPRDDEEAVNDTYENYLEIAYAKEVEDDGYLQDEDGMEEGPFEEEIDRTEVFSVLPRVVFTVEMFSARTGWTPIYKGSGGTCNVEGLQPSTEVQFRVSVTEHERTSPWTLFSVTTKECPGSGNDLVEAVKENNATAVRDVIADLTKYSQIERVDVVAEEGHTALVSSIMTGSRDALAVLVEKRAGVAAPTGGPHLTPLVMAAFFGRTDFARRLRAAGATWNHPDRNGLTPLHYAVCGCQTGLVTMALQEGADPKVLAGGHPILSLAVISAYVRKSPRMRGIAKKESNEKDDFGKMIDILVEGGAQVNQVGYGGNAALHVALTLHQAKLARLIYSLGGDTNLTNARGYTPTFLATLSGHQLDTPTPRDDDRPPMNELEELIYQCQ
ncbi:fibronectin type 3 and ankyrin repeat domains protein 1-like isoform X3 [Macrobrachium rosenbergii]|uniref:fibronectin type 3 and ankyrin repeat domains protein 1-like isoform X3 n=1 Tax=Macrobrachium rosenbergii TaxID=79674 RepID=UPI0034D6903E